MGEKVTFDATNKIIQVDEAPVLVGGDYVVDIDIKTDIYSDGKEDWLSDPTLNKFRFPVKAVGGQDLPGSKQLGTTFFLNYGWKIRPYEGSHVFRINGNLYTDTGDSPFTSTVGTYNVMVIQAVSSLVDSTVQQLSEIEYASFNGGVTVDVTSLYEGTEYPVGTPRMPVNNLADALDIATARGFGAIYIIGDITIGDSLSFTAVEFVGQSHGKTTIEVESSADVTGCEIYDAEVTGTLDGDCIIKNCRISDITYINGTVELCLIESGTVTLGGGADAHFIDCWCGVESTLESEVPVVDMGGSGQSLAVRNYNGCLKIANKTGSDSVTIDLNSGVIFIDETVVSGTIVVRGVGEVINQSTSQSLVVDTDNLLNPNSIANFTWGKDFAKRLLGMMQENYYLYDTSYTLTSNGQKLMTHGIIQTYRDSASVGTGSNLLAKYEVNATYSDDELLTYKVTKLAVTTTTTV